MRVAKISQQVRPRFVDAMGEIERHDHIGPVATSKHILAHQLEPIGGGAQRTPIAPLGMVAERFAVPQKSSRRTVHFRPRPRRWMNWIISGGRWTAIS
jgi:hypothetical protein